MTFICIEHTAYKPCGTAVLDRLRQEQLAEFPNQFEGYVLVEMLQTRYGTEDGFTVGLYHEGHEYLMSECLARNFAARGWAQWIREPRFTKGEC